MEYYEHINLEKLYFPTLPVVETPIKISEIKDYSKCILYDSCRENCGCISCNKWNYKITDDCTDDCTLTTPTNNHDSAIYYTPQDDNYGTAISCTHSNTRTTEKWSHVNRQYDSVRKCLDCGTLLSVY